MMKEIGDILKQRREEKKFSQAYINAQTHIPLKYISALEEGDISVFPAEIYFLGALRRYARFLGLNDEDVVGMYRHLMLEPGRSNTPVKHVRDVKLSGSFFLALLAAIVILCVGILVWVGQEISLPTVLSRAKLLPHAAWGDSRSARERSSAASKRGELVLGVECVEDAWIEVGADGKVVFEGTLRKGDRKEWNGKDKFRLSVGYVPGIRVNLNGKPIDISVGAKKDVNSVRITKDSFEVIQSTLLAHPAT